MRSNFFDSWVILALVPFDDGILYENIYIEPLGLSMSCVLFLL